MTLCSSCTIKDTPCRNYTVYNKCCCVLHTSKCKYCNGYDYNDEYNHDEHNDEHERKSDECENEKLATKVISDKFSYFYSFLRVMFLYYILTVFNGDDEFIETVYSYSCTICTVLQKVCYCSYNTIYNLYNSTTNIIDDIF